MKSKGKALLFLSLVLFGGLLIFARGFAPTQAGQADKIEPGLRDSVIIEGQGKYLVYLTTQADLNAAAGISDWSTRGQVVYDVLRETAASSQAGLLEFLRAEQKAGNVSSIHSFFIVNAIQVRSNVATLDALAARRDVARIEASRTFRVPEPTISDIEVVEWGVARIGADQVWADFGFLGQGVVVANIDTGVDYDHPALVNQYRGNLGGGSFDHDFNWWDPSEVCGSPSLVPCDNNDHGTHTMGTMVGDDGGANQIGVAPEATWIAAKGCESNFCSDFALLSSAEWILAPCPAGVAPGDPSCDANIRPHVVNNSWGGGGGDTWYQASVVAWRAAGIFPAFSAGNSGPGPGTVGSPGDYAESFGSGATDINDVIASFSSRGPSSLTNEIKPDVSAPGVSVRSSIDGGGYASFNGTSMASPHVAGCVALLMTADPSLSIDDAENLLRDHAVDLGAPGPDFDYGYGRIDCYESVSNLQPGFTLSATPASRSVCAPGNTRFRVDVGQVTGFSDPVALSVSGAPAGTLFYPSSNVTPPGSAILFAQSGAAAGQYTLDIMGFAAGATPTTRNTSVNLNVFNANPGTPTLVNPPNGATGVPLVPTFSWNASPQADRYLIVLRDANGLVGYAVTTGTSYSFPDPLMPLHNYQWSVKAYNPCGQSGFAPLRSFQTLDIPPILLVDDDDNAPNVQATYTDALDALGAPYDVWDTNNSDNEPNAATLAQYEMVIWFTGDEFGGFAGPSAASEGALGTYLDNGGCFFISSQDYRWDRGVTAFMQNYLGVSTITNDNGDYTSVTGQGSIYGGLGTHALAYPFSDYSDPITPNATAETAWLGNNNNGAAINRIDNIKATFWAYPWEALPAAARQSSLSATIGWCATQ